MVSFFFFSSRRRHTRYWRDWSSDVCSSDLAVAPEGSDTEHKTPYYGPAQFTYDAVHDQYRCPQGQLLFPFHREEQAQLVEYRAVAGTCNACPLKLHCTPNKRGRPLHRSFFADFQERVTGYHRTSP